MISVVIPAYRNPSDVRALVDSLHTQCRSGVPFEIVVVDDGSGDSGFDRLAGDYPGIRLLRLRENAGASTARNVGARAARYDVLLFLDSDMQVHADVVGLVAEMFRRPDVAAVVGAVDPVPVDPTTFTRFWGLVKAYSLPAEDHSSTFYPMIGAIRKGVFLRIGGFDEGIKGASVEDYEISIRLRAAGVRVHYNPALLVRTRYHSLGKSLRQSFSRSGKWLLLDRGARFDNHTTTASQAAGVVAGALMVISLCLAALDLRLAPLSVLLLGVYGGVNRRFFRYVARRASLSFLPTALVLHLLLSVVVCAGVARAVPFLLLDRERRIRQVRRV